MNTVKQSFGDIGIKAITTEYAESADKPFND